MPQLAPALGSIAINLAIGIGASVLASAVAPKQTSSTTLSTPKGFSFELQTGEAVPVSAVLGKGRAKGQLIYHNSYGADNEYLQIVVKVGHGWHDGMEAFLIDEKAVTLSGSNGDAKGMVVDEFVKDGTPYMWVKFYAGAPGQAADPELVANANPSTRWTSAHKLTGCAYYILTCRYQSDLYGSTIPLSGSVWRGVRMFDWRNPDCIWGDQSTYVATTNPAVIRYNFKRGIFVNGVRILGQGFSAWACDAAGYTAAANRCDEIFYDPETDTTFPVFEYGREVGDDEAKLGVLAEIDASYCGSSFKRGGADVPLPAQQLISVLTLNDADRLTGYAVTANKKGSVSTKKTMWSGQFVSADAAYGLSAYSPRIDAALETVIGGRKSVAMDQPYEWLQPRAQLRAEIALRRQLYPATRVETFTPKAFVLEPGDPVTRVCEWGSVLMVVQKVSRVMVDGRWIGVTVTMSQWDNSIVPASGDSFVTIPAEPGPGPSDPSRTIAVSGLAVTPFSREGGGAIHAFGRATWTQINDPNVDQVMIRLWPSAGTEADDHEDFFADSKLTDAKLCGPLQPLTEYVYKAIPVRNDARTCAWTNTATFTTGAETVPAVATDVTQAQLVLSLQAKLNWLTNGLIDVIDNLQAISGTLQDQDAANYDDKRQVLANVTSQVGDVKATVTSVAETLATHTTAIAGLTTGLTATTRDATASGLWKIEAQSAPAGVDVKVGSFLSTDVSGVVTNAFETLEIASDGTSTKTVVCDIWQTLNAAATAGVIVDNRTGNISMGSLV